MKPDKEKRKIIRRYFDKLNKDKDLCVSITFDKICWYYIVDIFIPFVERITRAIVDDEEYLRIKEFLSESKKIKLKK